MTITQLIQQLTDTFLEFGNMDVIMASDEEGNSYCSLYDMSLEFISTDRQPGATRALLMWPGGRQDDIEFVSETEDED